MLFKLAGAAAKSMALLSCGIQLERKIAELKDTLDCALHPASEKETDVLMMKKSTFGAILAFLAAAVGVLTAAAIYLHRREKELDEYEQLLFSEDFDDDTSGEAEEAAQEAEAPAPAKTEDVE